jgi:hypothetical protein
VDVYSLHFCLDDCSAPLRKPDGWLAWGLLGILLSPFTVYIAAAVAAALGIEDIAGRGTADAVSQIITLDTTTYLALFGTTGVPFGCMDGGLPPSHPTTTRSCYCSCAMFFGPPNLPVSQSHSLMQSPSCGSQLCWPRCLRRRCSVASSWHPSPSTCLSPRQFSFHLWDLGSCTSPPGTSPRWAGHSQDKASQAPRWHGMHNELTQFDTHRHTLLCCRCCS